MDTKRTGIEKQVDQEILSKGSKVKEDFDHAETLIVPAKKRANKLISIRLPMSMIKQLREIAEVHGDIGYQQVIKTYIAEGLARDSVAITAQTFPYAISGMQTRGSTVCEFWSSGPRPFREEAAASHFIAHSKLK